jgi:neutral amino acid transport system ATP-binding protein
VAVTSATPPAAEREQLGDDARPMLRTRGLVKDFNGFLAVNDVDLSIAPGTVHALVGPNGAGKTTLFNVVTGFYRPHGGRVRFDGQPVTGLPPHRLARMGLVRTFQITKALAAMPVIDNMMLAAPAQPGERLSNVLLRPRAAPVE